MLDKSSHYEGRRLVEVYDDAQRAGWIEISTKEALATGRRILFTHVGPRYGVEDCRHVLAHLRSASLEMTFGAPIEHHSASVRILCLMGVA
jgi:hypothetical protein